ncbi:MAG: BrnT family toxin [Burkholderiales bacterium]
MTDAIMLYVQKAWTPLGRVHTICSMRIEFDPTKNVLNIRSRGLSFEAVADFDFATARVARDERRQYPEVRYVAIGWIGERLHVLCFTPIPGGIRVISFRKANRREVRVHEQAPPTD